MKRSLLLASVVIAGLPGFSRPTEERQAVASFVQGFYDWYAPLANKEMHRSACEIALKSRSKAFTPELSLALQTDLNAQAKSPGVIVGIDWDPFLNSQDPETQYRIGTIKPSKNGYLVDIHSVAAGKRSPKPSVVAEVIKANGEWVFSNFHSPQGSDLLASLARLLKERQKAK